MSNHIKLTKSQEEEIRLWEYFIPKSFKSLPKTDNDIKLFFEWSEKGLNKSQSIDGKYEINSYFNALREGKRLAGIHWKMYEEGVLEGTMPYFTILGGNDKKIKRKWWQIWKPKYAYAQPPIPDFVVKQMKKEMFKGIDADRIEKCYQDLLKTIK